EAIPQYPYVPFIPTTLEICRERLPPRETVTRVFQTAGFLTKSAYFITQQIAPTWGAYAERLAAGGDSILASLTPVDLERGLSAIRDHAKTVDPRPVTEPIDLFVF